jgi:hypothetical protein
MAHPQMLAERRAKSRLSAVEVAKRLGKGEATERLVADRDHNVLTGKNTDHVPDDLIAAAFELIDELSERVQRLEAKPRTKR